MAAFSLLPVTLLLIAVPRATAFPNGAPCQVEKSMTPDFSAHGTGQPWNDVDEIPPYFFQFADQSQFVTGSYESGKIYTIRLSGSATFRGFIIQARYIDGGGKITEGAVGRFAYEETWPNNGIKHMGCSSGSQATVTHSVATDKSQLNFKWEAPISSHPIQFIITVVQSRSYFWVKWTPKSGFIVPHGWTGVRGLVDATSAQWGPGAAGQTGDVNLSPASRSESISVVTETDGYGNPISTSNQKPQSGSFGSLGSSGLPFSLGTVPDHRTSALERKLGIEKPETCATAPCNNGGTCIAGRNGKIEGYHCVCPKQWDGLNCESHNYCGADPCVNGRCYSENNGYKCVCQPGYGGSKCQLLCPPTYCHNGGTCKVNDYSQYSCKCASGWVGQFCEIDEDACLSYPCQNGGTCQDQQNGYYCTCAPGFIGDNCERPCVDIYGQCDSWAKEHQKCVLRSLTRFFDRHCPVSCNVCYPDAKIEVYGPPTIPDLDPLAWIVGEWETKAPTPQHFPMNFDIPQYKYKGYDETIMFSVSVVPAFGAPYLNYSAFGRSEYNYYDIQQTWGFLILEPRTKPNYKCALKSLSNNGILMVEDAPVPKEKKELVFKSSDIYIHPDGLGKKLIKSKRTIGLYSNSHLKIETFMLYDDGTSDEFTNYYSKVKGYEYYKYREFQQ